MDTLIRDVEGLKARPDVRAKVEDRLYEFSMRRHHDSGEWFSELCFCLLTSNSKAKTAMQIQARLGGNGFLTETYDGIKNVIIMNRHRFHNVKTDYIISARQFADIKDRIEVLVQSDSPRAAREWLVENIRGFSYKESSHFLRNVGFFDLAILDRHILNLMLEHGMIDKRPATLNRQKYLMIEDKFRGLSKRLGMSCAELDFYMWYLRTGEVLK